jgi:hypothetical protein
VMTTTVTPTTDTGAGFWPVPERSGHGPLAGSMTVINGVPDTQVRAVSGPDRIPKGRQVSAPGSRNR